MSFEPMSYGMWSHISQQEFDLASLSLDVHDGALCLLFPGGDRRPLTDAAFGSLCRVIQVPLGFARRLRDDEHAEMLTYLQKQMSVAYLREQAVVVCDASTARDTSGMVLAVTTKDYILPSVHAVCDMDAEILKAEKGTLRSRSEGDGCLRYRFITKKAKPAADDCEYEYGHEFVHSMYGLEQPSFRQVAVRESDAGVMVMPFKPEKLSTQSASFIGDLVSKVEHLDSGGWTELEGYLQRLKMSKASLREVKDTKQRLVKGLKADKEDRETETRMEEFFHWKKLAEAYEIRGLVPKPSKKWYMSARSDLDLLDVFVKLVSETTHAPSTVAPEKRERLQKYATKLLGKLPDLAEKEPPKVMF